MSAKKSYLRPSAMPALAQCSHYEGKPGKTVESTRGDEIHAVIDSILRGEPIGSVIMKDVDVMGCAEWAVDIYKKEIQEIKGSNYPVTISDGFEEVMPGTLDVWGMTNGELILGDTKSGQHRGHQEQYLTYALGLMDETGKKECRILAAFCDLKAVEDYVVTLDQAVDTVFPIVEAFRAKGNQESPYYRPPTENDYCGLCRLQSTCPVWVGPAKAALTKVAPAGELAEYIANLEAIKSDPVKVGIAIEQAKKFMKVWKAVGLEDFAKGAITAGEDIPGWKLSHVSGTDYFPPEDVEKILHLLPEMGTQRAREFVKIDAAEFVKQWNLWTQKSIPVQPTKGAGYTKLLKERLK